MWSHRQKSCCKISYDHTERTTHDDDILINDVSNNSYGTCKEDNSKQGEVEEKMNFGTNTISEKRESSNAQNKTFATVENNTGLETDAIIIQKHDNDSASTYVNRPVLADIVLEQNENIQMYFDELGKEVCEDDFIFNGLYGQVVNEDLQSCVLGGSHDGGESHVAISEQAERQYLSSQGRPDEW